MASGRGKSIWEVLFQVGGRTDPSLNNTFRQARQQINDLQKAAKQLGTDWKNFTGNLSKLTLKVAGGITAATVGVVAMANSVAEAGWEAAKTSAAVGMGVESYQELRYAMEQAGVEAGTFQSAMTNMVKVTREGAAGNEAYQKQLAEIGLSADKLSKMAPEKALERISDYMNSLSSDAKRAQVATALFGEAAGAEMMTALKGGSEEMRKYMEEAQRTGNILNAETVKMSGDYRKAQKELTASFSGMKTQFISGALGPLAEAFKTLSAEVQGNMPAIQELGQRFGEWLGSVVSRMPEIIAHIRNFVLQVWAGVTKVKDFVGGWGNLAKIVAGIAIAPTFIAGLKTVWSFGKLIQTGYKAIGPILAGIKAAGVAGFGGVVSAAAPVILIIGAIIAVIILVAKNWDKIRAAAVESFDKIKAAIMPFIDALKQFWAEHGEKVKAVFGMITDFVSSVFVTGVQVAFDLIAMAVKNVMEALKILWNIFQAGKTIVETVVGAIAALFRGDFQGAIDIVGGGVEKLGEIFSKIFDGIKNIVGNAADFIKDKLGKVGNFLGSIGSFFSGNTGEVNIEGHAEGGIFTHRHIAEIAERGAEAVVPLNNSAEGRAIWEQAGKMGGYANAVQEVGKVIPFPASAKPEASASPTLVERAAGNAQNGVQVVISFTQQNTFSGAPDSNTIRQVEEAGRSGADNIEARIEAYFKRQKRARYA